VKGEITNDGTLRVAVYRPLVFILKYVAPVGILFIFLNEIGLFKLL
jgi:NSS family neurotransmitter:Na+ symporter